MNDAALNQIEQIKDYNQYKEANIQILTSKNLLKEPSKCIISFDVKDEMIKIYKNHTEWIHYAQFYDKFQDLANIIKKSKGSQNENSSKKYKIKPRELVKLFDKLFVEHNEQRFISKLHWNNSKEREYNAMRVEKKISNRKATSKTTRK